MKKLLFLCLSAIMVVCFTGCGSSKSISKTEEGYEQLVNDICISLQEQSPETRAFGMGEHFNMNTANNIAELQARGKFARAIATAIKQATRDQSLGLTKYAADDNSGSSVTDQANGVNDWTEGIAQEIVRNTVIIKTSRYKGKNNLYRVYVCLEYKAGLDAMVEKISETVKDRISDADKDKLNSNFEKFRNEIKRELENSSGK